jgi:small neutral amino acid transporter SnatA (MarC family)
MDNSETTRLHDHSLEDIVALLAISKPLGAMPVFLALADGATPFERLRAALRAAVAVTTTCSVGACGEANSRGLRSLDAGVAGAGGL